MYWNGADVEGFAAISDAATNIPSRAGSYTLYPTFLLTGPLLFDFELLFELPDVLFLCLYQAQLEFSLLLQLLLQSFLHLKIERFKCSRRSNSLDFRGPVRTGRDYLFCHYCTVFAVPWGVSFSGTNEGSSRCTDHVRTKYFLLSGILSPTDSASLQRPDSAFRLFGSARRRTASALRQQSLLLPPVCDRLDGRVSVVDTNVAVELQFSISSSSRVDVETRENSSVSYLEVCRNVRYSIALAVTRAEACVRTRSGRLHDEGSDHGNVRPRTGNLGGVSRGRSSPQGLATISTASRA